MRIPMAGGRAMPGNSMRGRRRAVSMSYPDSSFPSFPQSPVIISPPENQQSEFVVAPENQEFDFSFDAGILPPTPRYAVEERRAITPTPGHSNQSAQDPDLLGIPPRPVTAFSYRLNEPRARNANIYIEADPEREPEPEPKYEAPNSQTHNNTSRRRDDHLEALGSLNRAARLGAQASLFQRSRSFIFGPPQQFFDSASAQSGRMYGQAYLDHGAVQYQPTRRLADWLEGISLADSPPESKRVAFPEVNSSNGGQAGSSSLATLMEDEEMTWEGQTAATERPQTGLKRRGTDLDNGPSKRSRLSMPFKRAISRLSGGTKTRWSMGDVGTLMSRAGEAISRAGDTSGRGTPFSMMSRAFAPAPVISTRSLKICILGHAGAGKTTLINRLLMAAYLPGNPSVVTDFRTINTITSGDSPNKTVAQVELWDFPSHLAGQRHTHLTSTFFNAAIICYNIEDKRNLETDRRPTFPNLGLRFLTVPDPATNDQGKDAAAAVNAAGFAECSARTGENCRETWQSIVDYLVQYQEENEKTLEHTRASMKGRGKMLEKMKETWHAFKKDKDVKEKRRSKEPKKGGN
ncbi:hypothetical protein B0T21DRAFT_306086 [Apiosordaria backusii]|uniref:Uncharacterized protein n=1 Tax=Apiosordaria backusii TaxID=314023 RepID=A0AA40EM07_9PEZI|nr:hypothetical protein B0T21DRAFT_306086 [Apiosordaria backusii]